MAFYDDPLVFYDDPAVFFDDPGSGHPTGTPLNQPPPALGTSHMEYWEITKDRAQKTLPVWEQYVPTLKIGSKTSADLQDVIDQFEPRAQARTVAQDVFDEAARGCGRALLFMKILGTKVPQIIDGQLSSDEGIRDDLNDLFRTAPRSEATILKRARELHPIWVRANAMLAAMTPALPPITRPLAGVAQTAAMLKTLLDGYSAQIDTLEAKEELLAKARSAIRGLDRTTDVLNKDFYRVMKATYDPGSPEYEALSGIPTEGGTPAPDAIDLKPLKQGGDDGLHVLASYEPGGGDHATTREVEYLVEGVDTDFGHAVALDASGNALGPFTVGQVVKVRTKVSNSSGTRTSAVRTITIEEPL